MRCEGRADEEAREGDVVCESGVEGWAGGDGAQDWQSSIDIKGTECGEMWLRWRGPMNNDA